MQLVFIHGSGGTKEGFQHQTAYFENSEAVNLPGHPSGKICTTIEEYADWLHAYILDRQYKEVVLAGHSLGGGIALTYALKYPESLKGVVLLGSGLRLRVHPDFLKLLEEADATSEQFQQMISGFHQKLEPELSQIMTKRAMENGPAVMLNDMRACDQFDVMGREAELTVPILAVCGTDDMMTPPKYSHFVEKNIPSARAVLIEGGTHFAFAEKPDQVNSVIEGFLGEL
ncbi:MAG: alpha/beta hydrolase [Thermodesulfobacteriota bacterium]